MTILRRACHALANSITRRRTTTKSRRTGHTFENDRYAKPPGQGARERARRRRHGPQAADTA